MSGSDIWSLTFIPLIARDLSRAHEEVTASNKLLRRNVCFDEKGMQVLDEDWEHFLDPLRCVSTNGVDTKVSASNITALTLSGCTRQSRKWTCW